MDGYFIIISLAVDYYENMSDSDEEDVGNSEENI